MAFVAFVVPSFSYLRCHLSLPHPWISNRKQVAFGRPVRGRVYLSSCRTRVCDANLLASRWTCCFAFHLAASNWCWSICHEQKTRGACCERKKMPITLFMHLEDPHCMKTFFGAVREIREETRIESCFLDVFAFWHAHQVTFDKSDILFICTLKPLSFDVSVDESEIEAAQWMPLDEFINQPFRQEDEMCKAIVDICIARYQKCYTGFGAYQVTSKLDNRVAYFQDTLEAAGCVPETSWYKV